MNNAPSPAAAPAPTPAAPVHVPRMLNGIDAAALEAVGGVLAADPSQAMVGFRATTSWRGGLRSSSEITEYRLGGQSLPHRFRFDTDEPVELLGENTAPNPQDLLLAALNACVMVGFVGKATAAGIVLDALEIESSCDFDLRGALGLDPSIPGGARSIRQTIRIRAAKATRAQLEELHAAVLATSPNVYHLTRPITIEGTLVVG